jgi:ABC-type transport system involved in multi-copper enzyme maturation permease subunit
MTEAAGVPSIGSAIWALVRLTFARLRRGKQLWISVVIGALPIVLAALLPEGRDVIGLTYLAETLVLAVVPAMLVSASIGEELEDRTAAYLWSRPLPRWTILAGKLLALAPFAAAVVAGSWIAAVRIGTHELPATQTVVGVAAGALAISAIAAGIATLAPNHGLSLTIVYMFADATIGAIPASIRSVSVTHAASSVAGVGDTSQIGGAIALVVIAGVWLAVAFRRIGRLET